MFKAGLLGLALLFVAAPTADAASFSMKRGINLDIWVTWPDESQWGDEKAILPFPEWRKSVTEADLKSLKDNGFDFVRMPVDPSPFLSGKTTGLRDKLFASVLESVRLVNASGLKVIVDMHLVPAGGNRSLGMAEVMNDPKLFDAYVDLTRAMAKSLSKEDPTLVAFEAMNEPVIDCKDEKTSLWPEKLQRLFAAARASATRLTLVLTGACYSNAESLAKLDPKTIPDDNVIWTFHSYDPFLLTHQGATWAGDFIPYVTGLPYPPYAVPRTELDAALDKVRAKIKAEAPWTRRSGMLAYLDEQIATMDTEDKLLAVMDAPFKTVDAWARKHGIKPENIFLGEFGMIRQEYGNPYVMPAKYRAAYVRDMSARAEAHGFSWSVWSYGGAFGVVEQFDGKPAEPDVLEMVRGLE
ncbi:cellulase family glycosylhydrolase [Mesorhizobium sp. YR577]|uniref:glycoside hydrolase family 5 protein n=1 Tax=Mesorhizobium sp. YR577 TaxID=1884373 RepID=UPI0008F27AA3|nr:cellulase family glycosylhydrolase [Mesorhizobium sp. YR577]SFT45531.1 Cellulase (glycosyl hydrolase family 5) [Mesorhizobium sp. YR577]